MESLQLSQVLADLSNLGAAVRNPLPPSHSSSRNFVPDLGFLAGTRGCCCHRQRQYPLGQTRRTRHILPPSCPASAAPRCHETRLVVRRAAQVRQARSPHPHQLVQLAARVGDEFDPRHPASIRRTFASALPQETGYQANRPPLQTDDDLERASTLMTLYDIRAKIKQQDNSSLMKAREKINALAAKQQAQQAAERNFKTAEELRRNRYSFPKSGL
ncbi:hypothetical protein DCS_06298 [Drechmeria coniospora]|uniref:Uncharacterized protein n=1 Tax=Drechmeria coniospora TaxID=98403 RepID=A0A151GBC1_DRECN|nr:hypothetical protein DCS_06298 [Drechmeria coniospora]KYK54341.1 hypothetical protein DCS_06298 [Drechmeria coniospora]